MRSVSSTYKQIIASGNTRNWLVKIEMTLADDTELEITESDIMENSFKIMSASSGQNTFDIGSAIIGKCSFTLQNINDEWTEYDFFNATAVVWVKLIGDSEYHRMGFYTVEEPTLAGALVQIEMLDNMWKFDVPYGDVNVSYPATCQTIVNAICSHVGVTLSTQQFHGYTYSITKAPEEEINCREMLQYIAMIGCNFCTMTDNGALEIKWYDFSALPSDDLDGGTFSTNTTPYSDGDDADGGNFTNYLSGDDYNGGTFTDSDTVAYFTRLFSRNVGTDRIEVTGVKFVLDETEYIVGAEGYVLTLENPLVDASNVTSVLNLIWDILNGFMFRTFNVTALPDIAPQVGDCTAVSYKGHMVYTFLTNYVFTPSLSTASLGAVTPTRTLTTRYSKSAQASVEISRKQAKKEISTYDLAVQAMNVLAINAMGAYQEFEDLETGGRVYYLSNKPITKTNNHCSFVSGSTVFKTTGDGLFVSVDGGQTWRNGYDAQTGTLLVNVLKAIGLEAEWIVTGLLRDRQNYNYWNLDTGEFRMMASTKVLISDADYTGAYDPTLSNAPASGWNDYSEHLGETFRNTATNKSYIFSRDLVEGDYSLEIKFNSQCNVGSNTWFQIYYEENGGYYYKWFHGAFGAEVVRIPTANFIIRFKSDTESSRNKYGWSIDHIKVVDEDPDDDFSFSWSGAPTADETVSVSGVDLTVQSEHNPYESCDRLYEYATGLDLHYIEDYTWSETTLEVYTHDTAQAIIDENMTQEEIFNALTNNGTVQGLEMVNGQLYFNGAYIKTKTLNADDINAGHMSADFIQGGHVSANVIQGGTLVLGGNNNANGVLVIKDASGNTIGTWNNSGINISGGTVNINGYAKSSDLTSYATKSGLAQQNYTSINGGNINTGEVKSANYSAPTSGHKYSSAGTKLNLTNGQLISKSFNLDATTAQMHVRQLVVTADYSSDDPTLNYIKVIHPSDTTQYTLINQDRVMVKSESLFSGNDHSAEMGSDYFVIDKRWRHEGSGSIVIAIDESRLWISLTQGFVHRSNNLSHQAKLDCDNGLYLVNDDYSPRHSMSVYDSDIFKYDGTQWTVHWYESDRRIKEDIKDLDTDLSVKFIDKTDVVSFKYISKEGKHYGVIAQDVREVLDSLGETDAQLEHGVSHPERFKDTQTLENQRTVEYHEYIPHLINYVKDLREIVERQQKEIDELKAMIKKGA